MESELVQTSVGGSEQMISHLLVHNQLYCPQIGSFEREFTNKWIVKDHRVGIEMLLIILSEYAVTWVPYCVYCSLIALVREVSFSYNWCLTRF